MGGGVSCRFFHNALRLLKAMSINELHKFDLLAFFQDFGVNQSIRFALDFVNGGCDLLLNGSFAVSSSTDRTTGRYHNRISFFHIVENSFFVKVSAYAEPLFRLFERERFDRKRRCEFRADGLITKYCYNSVTHIIRTVELRQFGRIYERAFLNGCVAVYVVRFDSVVPDVARDNGKVTAPLREFFHRLKVARADERLDIVLAVF